MKKLIEIAPCCQGDRTKHAAWLTSDNIGIPREFDGMSDSAFVRITTVCKLLSCSHATIWRWVKTSKLPAPKKLGPRLTAWNVGEIRLALRDFMTGAHHG